MNDRLQRRMAMGLALGVMMMAERVDDAARLAFLETQDCDFGQGWWFDRPAPADEIDGLLDEARNRIARV